MLQFVQHNTMHHTVEVNNQVVAIIIDGSNIKATDAIAYGEYGVDWHTDIVVRPVDNKRVIKSARYSGKTLDDVKQLIEQQI